MYGLEDVQSAAEPRGFRLSPPPLAEQIPLAKLQYALYNHNHAIKYIINAPSCGLSLVKLPEECNQDHVSHGNKAGVAYLELYAESYSKVRTVQLYSSVVLEYAFPAIPKPPTL